jgi:hypothetical protein
MRGSQPLAPAPLMGVSLRAARLVWILVGIAVCVHVVVSPERHNLWPVFRLGAQGWENGTNIYIGDKYFSYSPVFAVLLAPLVALPWVLGNLLFDVGGLALLFHATRRLIRVVFPEALLSHQEPAILLLSLFGVLRCVWSSQAHTWSAALTFLAAAALVEQRWWAASFALALAIHLKLAPVVLLAIAVECWPQTMWWRSLAAVAAWAILPIVHGRPTQAVEMYRQWGLTLQLLAVRRFVSFRDAWHLFEIADVPLPMIAYRVLQATAGLGVLLWTWHLRRRCFDRRWLVSGSFALGIAYMLVFGPAVEFTQYPLLAPWISAALLAAWPRSRERVTLAVIFVLTMIAGFGAVETVLSSVLRSRVPEALSTLGTIAFGAWVVRTWRPPAS